MKYYFKMLEPFVFGVKNVTHQKFLFPSMRPKETFEYLCGFVWMHAKEFFSWKMNIFNKNRMYFLKFSWLNIGFFLESTFGSLDITSLLLLWMHATFSFFPFLLEMSLTKFWLETTYFHSKCFFFLKGESIFHSSERSLRWSEYLMLWYFNFV